MTDPVLIVAMVVLAHLIADFVLQNDWIALNKGRADRTGLSALAVHGAHVGFCLIPAVLAFGFPGLVYLALVVGSHMAVDRWKVVATRRTVANAQELARRRAAATGPGVDAGRSPLGVAWTPIPGLLFLADQVLHLTIAIVGWLVILEGAAVLPQFVDFANAVLRDWDRSAVHATMLTGVVAISLFVVNTRGAFYFVASLVTPRELPETQVPGAGQPASPSTLPAGTAARVGTTIATLERLLIVALLLAGAPIVIGFVILVDTVARFRQLDDRAYVEFHLLGSFASLFVAIGSGMIAQAALASLR